MMARAFFFALLGCCGVAVGAKAKGASSQTSTFFAAVDPVFTPYTQSGEINLAVVPTLANYTVKVRLLARFTTSVPPRTRRAALKAPNQADFFAERVRCGFARKTPHTHTQSHTRHAPHPDTLLFHIWHIESSECSFAPTGCGAQRASRKREQRMCSRSLVVQY